MRNERQPFEILPWLELTNAQNGLASVYIRTGLINTVFIVLGQ